MIATRKKIDYPTGDGKPMAETDYHRTLMFELIEVLKQFYVNDPKVYVSGNLLLFYERGNKHKHVSPDCFVVFGVPNKLRDNYLTWSEGKSPNIVIELTSKTTRAKDTKTKFDLYEQVLKVPEYFLFDPTEDYLKPSMQGYQLRAGKYVPIKPVDNRLPSKQLGLHLERQGVRLRLWNPLTSAWLPTTAERYEAEQDKVLAEQENVLAEREKVEAERALRIAAESELAQLRALVAKQNNGHKNGTNGKH